MDLERQQKIAEYADHAMEHLDDAVNVYVSCEKLEKGRPPTHEEMELLVAGWLSALATTKRDIEERLIAQGGEITYTTQTPEATTKYPTALENTEAQQLENWFQVPAKEKVDERRGRDEINPEGETNAQTD